MRGAVGLTIIEVVIALSILAVGVLAAAGLQATSLRASRSAQNLQQINSLAQSQLETWRGLRLTQAVPATADCSANGLACEVLVRPCAVSASGLVCDIASVPNPAAHSVAITVASGDRELTLQTVVAK